MTRQETTINFPSTRTSCGFLFRVICYIHHFNSTNHPTYMPGMTLRWLLSVEGTETYTNYLTRVRAGVFPHVAGRSVGIVPSSLAKWLKRGKHATSGGHKRFFNDTMQAIADASSLSEMELRKASPKSWLQTGPRRYLGDEWRDEPQQTYALQIEGMVELQEGEAYSDDGRGKGEELVASLAELRKAGIDLNDLLDRHIAGDAPIALQSDLDDEQAVTPTKLLPTPTAGRNPNRPLGLITAASLLTGLRPSSAPGPSAGGESGLRPIAGVVDAGELRPTSGGTPTLPGVQSSTDSSPSTPKNGTPISSGSNVENGGRNSQVEVPKPSFQDGITEEESPLQPPSPGKEHNRCVNCTHTWERKITTRSIQCPKCKLWGKPIKVGGGVSDTKENPTNIADSGSGITVATATGGFTNPDLSVILSVPTLPLPLLSSSPEKFPVARREPRGITDERSEEVIHRGGREQQETLPDSSKSYCPNCNSSKTTITRSGKFLCLKCNYLKSGHSKSTVGQELPESMRKEHDELTR